MIAKKFGFTLAEVLITLVVIGVVAAMTVPAINQQTNNEQFKSAAFKNTSVLNNAISRNYAFTSEKIDYYKDADDFKTNFFFQNFNILNGSENASNDWGEKIEVETSFYLNDGAKYGITEKITNNCDYDTKNKYDNMPCFFVYVDVNGEKNPNKLTMTTDMYYDVNTYYAYADRFILEPGEIHFANNTPENNNPPSEDDSDDTPTNPPADDDDSDDTPTNPPADDDDSDDDDPNNNNEHKMERCLEKRPYDECEKFCKKNGYHSALCR